MARGDKAEEETEQDLATAIRAISKAMEDLTSGGLNRKAIIILIHDKCHVDKKMIGEVLDTLEILEHVYCTPED